MKSNYFVNTSTVSGGPTLQETMANMAEWSEAIERHERDFNEKMRDDPCPVCGNCIVHKGPEMRMCVHRYDFIKKNAREIVDDAKSICGIRIVVDDPRNYWTEETICKRYGIERNKNENSGRRCVYSAPGKTR